ncbi:hypothetical protein [Bartonella sp. CB169]|uniref:hypothetical protein n=1 Tax=Bartonella sp. CB169 TaxID=3112257 RepID=UPI00300E4B9E
MGQQLASPILASDQLFLLADIVSDCDRELLNALSDIREKANVTKHSKRAVSLTYLQVYNHMEVLKPLLMVVIDALHEKENCKNNSII